MDLTPLPVFSVSVNGLTNHPCQIWELPEHLPVLYCTNPIWHQALSLLPAKHLPHPFTAVVFIKACVISYCHVTGRSVPPYNLLPQSETHVIFLNKNPGYVSPLLKILYSSFPLEYKSYFSVWYTNSLTCLPVCAASPLAFSLALKFLTVPCFQRLPIRAFFLRKNKQGSIMYKWNVNETVN